MRRGDSGYRDTYRGGYSRPYSSPYGSPYGSPRGRGGYRGGYEGRDYDRGYDNGRGGYRGNRNSRYTARGDHHGYGSRRDSGPYQRSDRDSWFEREKTTAANESNAPNAETTKTSEPLVPRAATSQNHSPWVKLLGFDETERMSKMLGAEVKTEIDEIRRTHQANFFKLRDSKAKLKQIEMDTTIFQMQLSSLEAGINGYETYRNTRIDMIDKITLLGD